MFADLPLTRPPLSRSGRWLLAPLILLLGFASRVGAGSPSYPFDTRDVEIALHARQVLLQEPELANLNLGVIVRRGEATVWGSTPSWELAERALKVVEKVKGVYSVRSDLRVAGNLVEQAVQDLKSGLAAAGIGLDLGPLMETPPDRAASQAGVLSHPPGETLPQQVINARPPFPPDVATSGSLAGPGGERPTSGPLVATEKEEPPRAPAVVLLAPVPVTATSFSGPVVSLLMPRAVPASAEPVAPDLTAAVEQLRLADQRFRRLTAVVRDGVIVLGGSVAEPEHLIELARSLSRLPGVQSVDLRGIAR